MEKVLVYVWADGTWCFPSDVASSFWKGPGYKIEEHYVCTRCGDIHEGSSYLTSVCDTCRKELLAQDHETYSKGHPAYGD